MRYLHDTTEIRQENPSVVVIGKFDGFHRGHQKILREALAARETGGQVVMFTFSRPPQSLLSGRPEAGLTTAEERRAFAQRRGVDVLIEYPFTQEVRRMSADAFLRDILLDQLHARTVAAGPDCAFGYQRRGSIAFLQERSEEWGFSVRVVEKEIYRGEPISSTRIREVLSLGDVESARDMLGYSFGYCSEVEHGRQLGRTLGFPTVNQTIPPDKVIPAFGVYAVRVKVDGEERIGIANVGVKPTISGQNAAGVETYIYDFDRNVYGKTVQVELEHFVRPERKFASLESLKAQVEEDKEAVRAYWRNRVERKMDR